MKLNNFAGIYLFGGGRVPARLLRAQLAPRGAAGPVKLVSPEPGLLVPAGGQFTALRGRAGSWLQISSPDVEAGEAAGHYLKRGKSFPAAMHGQFAFSLYDHADGTLLLGSDRFSEIPVFYALFPGGIAWAEDPLVLSRLPGVGSGTDPQAVAFYLAMHFVPSPMTLYSGVRKLPTASVLSVRGGETSLSGYWEPPMAVVNYRSIGEAGEAVRAALKEAGKRRLGGVPEAAAMVSGGLDSSTASAVAAAMGVRMNTCTLGTGEGKYDFFSRGRALAAHIGSRHTEVNYGAPSADEIVEMSADYAEPQSDTCAYPLWKGAESLKGKAAVLISGDGGDENFAGYARIRRMMVMARDHKGPEMERLRVKAAAHGARVDKKALARIGAIVDRPLDVIYSELARIYLSDTGDDFGDEGRRELFAPGFLSSLGDVPNPAAPMFRAIFEDASKEDWLNRLTIADLKYFHPECTVPRLRAAAARAKMRMVFPMMDHKLVETARSVPEKWRLPAEGECKLVLRAAMKGRLPDSIVTMKQTPFHVPEGVWLRTTLKGLARDVLLGAGARTRPFIRRAGIERLLADHISGTREQNGRLWNLLMLELWLRAA